eukprot:462067-Alexandrium_andersonii.AAC.1
MAKRRHSPSHLAATCTAGPSRGRARRDAHRHGGHVGIGVVGHTLARAARLNNQPLKGDLSLIHI